MSDPRIWFKTDVGYFDNPKIADLLEDNPRVLILHLRAIAYCRQHLTDGVFPVRRVARMACASYCGSECDSQCDVCMALSNRMLERIDDLHYRVHDYAKHQDTTHQVNQRKTAGQKGAAARWGKPEDAKRNADRIGNGSADPNAEREERERDNVRDDVAALCSLLAARIEANGSKRPTIGKRWQSDARLLLDVDRRPLDEARRLIDWCQDSDFWRSNVLSMGKFREKYDTLRLQASKDQRTVEANPWAHLERPKDWDAIRAAAEAERAGGAS